MCKKTVFYNSYSDGLHDISERIQSCFPGSICPEPRVVEFDRIYNCPRSKAKLTQARDDRLQHTHSSASSATSSSSTSTPTSTPDHVLPTTSTHTMAQPIPIRRSATMTYSGMEPAPERGRRPIIVEPMAPPPMPAVYQTTHRLSPHVSRPVDVFQHTTVPSLSPSRRAPMRDFRDFRDARDVRDLRADHRGEYRDYRSDYRSPTRGERPFSLRRRTSEREPPVATTTIPASSIDRRNSVSTGTRDFLTPHYHSTRPRADSSPQGYASAEDAADRAERRRRRRHDLDRATVTPSSVPTSGHAKTYTHARTGSGYDSGFASSYESSGYTTASPAGSSFTPHTPSSSASVSATGADTSPKKNLRWKDEERRRQNERIRSRPKLARDDTITPASASASAKGAIKSILKNTTPGTSPSRSRSRSQRARDAHSDDARSTTNATIGSSSATGRRGSVRRDMDDLAGGVSGLNIHGNTPPASPRSSLDESEAERARLRDRFDQKPVPVPFSMPSRQYTTGGAHRRRTDVWPRDDRFM